MMFTRRKLLAAGAAVSLSACMPSQPPQQPTVLAPSPPAPPPPTLPTPLLPAFYGAVLDEPYPVPAVPEGVVSERLWRQQVDNPFPDLAPGSIVVDPDAGFLHLVESAATALRYGVGTGAQAYTWSGDARLQFGRKWPRWKVPASMISRRPDLAAYSVANGGMAPGPGNPLGARALYLFQNGKDTLYRIHGACEPEHLGKAVSSGCIRMLDQDVIDLYDRAPHGALVRVLASKLSPA